MLRSKWAIAIRTAEHKPLDIVFGIKRTGAAIERCSAEPALYSESEAQFLLLQHVVLEVPEGVPPERPSESSHAGLRRPALRTAMPAESRAANSEGRYSLLGWKTGDSSTILYNLHSCGIACQPWAAGIDPQSESTLGGQ